MAAPHTVRVPLSPGIHDGRATGSHRSLLAPFNVAGTSLNVAERRVSSHGNVAFVPALKNQRNVAGVDGRRPALPPSAT